MRTDEAWNFLVREFATEPEEPTEDDVAGKLTPPDVQIWMEREAETQDESGVIADILYFMEAKTPNGREKVKTIFNSIASGQPQPVVSVLLYDAARLCAAHSVYLAQDSLRVEMQPYDDDIWDDPVRADRQALSRESIANYSARKTYG